MTKKIIIEEKEKTVSIVYEGFSEIEVMGLLRFYEKSIWMQVNREIEKRIKKDHDDKIKSNAG